MSFAFSYARAIKEQDFLTVADQLNQFYKAFQVSEINLFFLSPAISVEKKKQVLKKVFDSLGYKEIICSFLYLLLDKKKWGELPAIMKHLNKIKEESQGFVLAQVESAFPLSPDLKEQLVQKLKLFFGKLVLLKEKPNPQLIGGLKIRAGGFVFDDSLSFHLKKIESQPV